MLLDATIFCKKLVYKIWIYRKKNQINTSLQINTIIQMEKMQMDVFCWLNQQILWQVDLKLFQINTQILQMAASRDTRNELGKSDEKKVNEN